MLDLTFSKNILFWYQNNTTQYFPWQCNKTIYTVWISEIMLQQTQVSTVIPFYKKFLMKFPTISTLATANLDEVLHIWSGLGYYKRAINLHKTAKIIMQFYNGKFPQDFNTILSFPGIGKSTAGAILSLALNQHYPILDSNVKRILIRYYLLDYHIEKTSTINKKLWLIIEQLIPNSNISIFNQAIMNLGRLICTHNNPSCSNCPINNHCKAFLTKNVFQYTQKKILKKRSTKIVWWLLLWSKQKKIIWLIKRFQIKIWQGLFCFPEFDDFNILNTWLMNHNLYSTKYHNMHFLKHNISNINLKIYPILYNVNKPIKFQKTTGIWYNLNTPSIIGLPKPVQKLLDSLKYF